MKPELLSSRQSVLVAVDFQEKLLPHISGREQLLRKSSLLIRSAGILGIPVIFTEQYPKGLGATIPPVSGLVQEFKPVEKTCFSCVGEPEFVRRLESLGRSQVVVIGVETHVCVAQTAVELAGRGFSVFVAADACGSRRAPDAELGLRRMESAGVAITGAEAVVFEWVRKAGTGDFKRLQAIVKES
jgi:nicotinamidase-related amidase